MTRYLWPFNVGKDFGLGNYIFRAVNRLGMLILTKMNILAMVLDLMHMKDFLLSDGSSIDKNKMFGFDMSSPVHILIFGKGPIDVWDDTMLTGKKEYFINLV